MSQHIGLSWLPRLGAPRTVVPRQTLTFVRLPMPALRTQQLRQAMRLQLGQYAGGAPFAFAWQRQSKGQVLAWIWQLAGEAATRPADAWPEPALDTPGTNGLRLLRRNTGFEGQHWLNGELLHSRWFASAPDTENWRAFARGCGFDPDAAPLPQASVAAKRDRPHHDWVVGNSLPVADPWHGWRWQAAVLAVGALLAAAAGVHLQTRQQLALETQRLAQTRSNRESALKDRAQYEQVATELEAMRALSPKLLQLELLDRVVASGVFNNKPAASSGAASSAPAVGTRPLAAMTVGAQLMDWDYRNGQLKLTLELANTELTMLDITRRLERVPGLGPLRVGQDGGSNLLTLSTAVTAAAAAPDPSAGR